MAAYGQVYDSRYLQADCQEPGSAPEPYAQKLSMGFLYLAQYQMMRQHRSQELNQMLPEGVLSIAIKADFWQAQKNERKAELVKY